MASDSTFKMTRKETAIRLLFALLFAAIYSVSELVVFSLAVLQFGFQFILGESNDKVASFSRCLNKYIFQVLQFVTLNQEEKPFPFSDWPTE